MHDRLDPTAPLRRRSSSMARHGQRRQQQVVVVTGASGGIGRATAIAFGAGAPRWRCSPAGRRASRAPPRRSRPPAAARSSFPSTSPTPTRSTGGRQRGGAARADRRLGQRRLHLGVRAVRRDRRRRSSSGSPRSATSATSTARMAALRPGCGARDRGHDRAGRARRWPTAASRCRRAYCGAKHAIQGFNESLRCELLHEQQQRARDHGADAGGQHPAVLLGALPAAAPGAAGAADLPARGRRRRGPLRRRPPAPPRVLGRRQHRWSP